MTLVLVTLKMDAATDYSILRTHPETSIREVHVPGTYARLFAMHGTTRKPCGFDNALQVAWLSAPEHTFRPHISGVFFDDQESCMGLPLTKRPGTHFDPTFQRSVL